jgi:hypothetical protein
MAFLRGGGRGGEVERWNEVDIGRSCGDDYVCGMRGLRHGEMVKGKFRSDREV